MFLSWNCTWLETSDWNCFSRNSDKRSRKVTKTNLDDDNVQMFSEYFYFVSIWFRHQTVLFIFTLCPVTSSSGWLKYVFFSLFIFRLLSLKKQRKLRLMFSPVYTEVFIVTNKVFLAFLAVSSDCRLFVQNILIVSRF